MFYTDWHQHIEYSLFAIFIEKSEDSDQFGSAPDKKG